MQPRFADGSVFAMESLFRAAIAIAANGSPIINPIKHDSHTDTNRADEFFGVELARVATAGCGRSADDFEPPPSD